MTMMMIWAHNWILCCGKIFPLFCFLFCSFANRYCAFKVLPNCSQYVVVYGFNWMMFFSPPLFVFFLLVKIWYINETKLISIYMSDVGFYLEWNLIPTVLKTVSWIFFAKFIMFKRNIHLFVGYNQSDVC